MRTLPCLQAPRAVAAAPASGAAPAGAPLSNGAAAATPDAARRPAHAGPPSQGRDEDGGSANPSPRAAGAPGLHARGSIPRVSEADEAGAGWGARYDDLLKRTAAGARASVEDALQTEASAASFDVLQRKGKLC